MPPTSATEGDSRRLILGAAVGYDFDQIQVFARSLRVSGYTGDVVLLVGGLALRLARELEGYGIEVRRVVQIRSVTRSIHTRRYGVYAEQLRASADRYDQVMLTDVRDVAFQRHPFSGIADRQRHYFLEGATHTIGSEPTNWRWTRGCLPPDVAQALSVRRISCSGITVGGTAEIIAYLDRMADLIGTVPLRIYRRIGHGYDQALHNRLVHLDPEVAGRTVENNTHIATMGLEPAASYRLEDDGSVCTVDGVTPAILHQYDRHPDIAAQVESRWRA